MVELWVVLLLYGGGVMDDLPLQAAGSAPRLRLGAGAAPGHVRALAAGRRAGTQSAGTEQRELACRIP